jgi:hypothetical protein
LRVLGIEPVIKAFAQDVAWPGSSLRALRRGAVWPPNEESPPSWHWQSNTVEVTADRAEEAIAAFVTASKPLAAHIAKYKSEIDLASLVVVGECEGDEIPSGFYLSPVTISSLQQLGLDLDVDFDRVSERRTRRAQ